MTDGQDTRPAVAATGGPIPDGEAEIRETLHGVEDLLDYLARQPDARLSNAFPEPGLVRLPGSPDPPAKSLSYFLNRIGNIRNILYPSAKAFQWATSLDDEKGRELDDLSFIRRARDFLSVLAYPATIETIGVTRVYRRQRLPRDIRNREAVNADDARFEGYGLALARRVKHYQMLVFVLLFVCVWAACLTYWGNALKAENRLLQERQRDIVTRIGEAVQRDSAEFRTVLNAGESGSAMLVRNFCAYRFRLEPAEGGTTHVMSGAIGVPLAGPMNPGTPPLQAERITFRYVVRDFQAPTMMVWMNQRQFELCQEREQLARREQELKHMDERLMGYARPALELANLPDFLYRVLTGVGASTMSAARATIGMLSAADPPVAPSSPPPPDARLQNFSNYDLESHRIALSQVIQGLIGNIMPMAYAALGALASLFRRISQKANAETLNSGDVGRMKISFILGLLTGAVIALFSEVVIVKSSESQLPLGSTAFALLAGFAADRVFGMFDQISERVFGTTQPPVPART